MSIKENIKLSKPEVSDNGYEGTINIIVDDNENIQACIGIEQKETWVEDEKVKKRIRRGVISGNIEDVVNIGWIPGNVVGGRIVHRETIIPPVPEDPEALLSWANGRVRKHKGNPIYVLQYYSFSIKEKDELLEDD